MASDGRGTPLTVDVTAGQAVELAIMDVCDTLLGKEPQDLVSRMQKMHSQEQKRLRKVKAMYPDPAASPGALSLPPVAHTGTFTDPHWGTIRITPEGDRLAATIGALPLLIGAGQKDEFRALVIDGDREFTAQYEIEGDRVTALVGATSEPEVGVRFERR